MNEHGRTIRRGVKLWKVSVAVFKSETYRCLRLERPTDEETAEDQSFPDGDVHLPIGLSAEWVKQLTAEQLVTVRDRRGFSKLEWRQIRTGATVDEFKGMLAARAILSAARLARGG